MRIKFTNHALTRSKQRNIWFEEIFDCIKNYDQISVDKDITCYKKLSNNQYILLTYTKDDNGDILVITVIKTSKINKYFG